MRYLKQFFIILAVTCAGELLRFLLPFPIPGSIYGLVLMLLLLVTKRIPLDSVKESAVFLIEIMPVMFIPAAVGITAVWGQLKPVLFPVVATTLITTVVVMAVTGRVTELLIRVLKRKEGAE